MVRTKILTLALSASLATTLTGCATTGPLTAEQKILGCAGMVTAGAVLGGVIGNNTGDGNSKQGALIGAAVGGGACAVWLAFENEADKRRLAEARIEALERGQAVQQTWEGEDGIQRSVSITPSTETQMVAVSKAEEPAAAESAQLCRKVGTTASYGSQSDTIDEIWCRSETGDWEPATEEMTSV